MEISNKPIIDLLARYRVIVECGDRIVWHTIGRGVVSKVSAMRCAVENGYEDVWIFDELGNKTYVSGYQNTQ